MRFCDLLCSWGNVLKSFPQCQLCLCQVGQVDHHQEVLCAVKRNSNQLVLSYNIIMWQSCVYILLCIFIALSCLKHHNCWNLWREWLVCTGSEKLCETVLWAWQCDQNGIVFDFYTEMSHMELTHDHVVKGFIFTCVVSLFWVLIYDIMG